MQVAKPLATQSNPLEEEGVLLPRPKLANSPAGEKTSCLFFHLLPLLGNQAISQGLLSPLRGEDNKKSLGGRKEIKKKKKGNKRSYIFFIPLCEIYFFSPNNNNDLPIEGQNLNH